jgi:hypothetical protein
MKSITRFIRSLFSLGPFGLIFLLMAFCIGSTALLIIDNFGAYTPVWGHAYAINLLEGSLKDDLFEMQLRETYYLYAKQYQAPEENYLQEAADYEAQIKQALEELEAQESISEENGYTAEDADLLGQIKNQLAEHRQTFDQLVAAYQADDLPETERLTPLSMEQHNAIRDTLVELVTNLEAERVGFLQTFPEDITFTIQWNTIALSVLLLLALLGYRTIAGITQPLLNIYNAVMAIGGDQYRPEMLAETTRHRGLVGRFAHDLDHFAKAAEMRDSALKQEVATLRQQLYESRRKRLKLTRPSTQSSAASNATAEPGRPA